MSAPAEDFYTSDEEAAYNDEAKKVSTGDPIQDAKGIWFAARAWYTRDTGDAEPEKADGGEVSIDSSWRDRDLRIIALQQAVAISARGSVSGTEAILKQAKTIENYLANGSVDAATPDPASA